MSSFMCRLINKTLRKSNLSKSLFYKFISLRQKPPFLEPVLYPNVDFWFHLYQTQTDALSISAIKITMRPGAQA